jgi:hypothetical protein
MIVKKVLFLNQYNQVLLMSDDLINLKAQYLNNNGYDSDIEHDKRIQKTLKKLDKLEIKKLFNTW